MKTAKHAALVAALALLAGCATTFRPWLLSKVHEGMNRTQVVKFLGNPDSVEMKDHAELLHYTYIEGYNPPPANIDIRDIEANQGLWEQQITRSLKEYRYVVTLVDGKVQKYEEIQDR